MVFMWLSIFLVILLVTAGLLVLVWILRPNQARIMPGLQLETQEVVNDGLHNAFTDLVYWKDHFYLVYVSSPSHFASPRSSLVIQSSPDSIHWAEIARLRLEGKDIRDPKLAVIRGSLFVFALLNASFDPSPYGTVFSKSADGVEWPPFQEIQPEGWLFGRPKSADGLNWYVSAHWREFNKAALFSSPDGEHWQLHAAMLDRPGVDETAVEFLPDGCLLATIRFEVGSPIFGSQSNSTLVATAEPPYNQWSLAEQSTVTRLDGPTLIRCGDQVLAVGRRQPKLKSPFQNQGSIFSRKRTAVFRVFPGKLAHLTDLASAGDTAYAGVTQQAGKLFISYYTSSFQRDYPWILGMLRPTSIQLARVDAAALAALKG